MPDATGLNSLLRQVGGSIGLAIFATLLGRTATRVRDSMLQNLTIDRSAVTMRVQALTQLLRSHGMDPASAQSTAARMLDFQLRQQAMVISFERMFMIAGIAFLCVLPLVLLLKMPDSRQQIDVHVEM